MYFYSGDLSCGLGILWRLIMFLIQNTWREKLCVCVCVCLCVREREKAEGNPTHTSEPSPLFYQPAIALMWTRCTHTHANAHTLWPPNWLHMMKKKRAGERKERAFGKKMHKFKESEIKREIKKYYQAVGGRVSWKMKPNEEMEKKSAVCL